MGSTTPKNRVYTTNDVVEINTVESIENSRSKLRMKECFSKRDIPQAEWFENTHDNLFNIDKFPYPIVVKRVFGFKGKGMQLLNDAGELKAWLQAHKDLSGWYFEKFYNYAREYRLHVAEGIGVFMSWRKLRTKESDQRWFFNSSNCNWVGEDHELFDKPSCWNQIEENAMKCLLATGLSIGAVDVRVQSSKEKNPKFIVCEVNSAPALGEFGVQKYKETLLKIVEKK
jgi:glutathione synthase/RimK-type ligase-like ATP-grasp enzyme